MFKQILMVTAVLAAALALASADYMVSPMVSTSAVVHQPVAYTHTHHHTHYTSVPYVYTAYSSPAYAYSSPDYYNYHMWR